MTSAHDALVAHLLAHSVRTGDFTLKSGQAELVVHRRQADDLPCRRGCCSSPTRRWR